MAKVVIYAEEADDDLLPDVCARCGEPATTRIRKHFSWHPPWDVRTSLPIHCLNTVFDRRRFTVRLPVCEAHRGHWRSLLLFNLGGFLLLCGLFVVAIRISNVPFKDDHRIPIFWASLVLLFFLWLVTAAKMYNASIRPGEINDRGNLLLLGIASEFRDAVEDERHHRDGSEPP